MNFTASAHLENAQGNYTEWKETLRPKVALRVSPELCLFLGTSENCATFSKQREYGTRDDFRILY